MSCRCKRTRTTMKKSHLVLLALALVLAACTKPKGYGDLSINIGYSINGKALITDSLCYHNEAGNEFMIAEIQWFVSNMALQDEQGEWVELNRHGTDDARTAKVFYFDTNIPESQRIKTDPIPVGRYKTLRFTFGLDEETNISGLFSNPPEANMFWPEPLGGGYHYMKLNGRYLDENEQLVPLNIHLGIGQNEDHTAFYQNYFTVELPIDFTIAENAENQLYLTMIIDNWFRQPNLYDFNVFGSAIMQNQVAQQALKENGRDVFSVMQTIENNDDLAMKKDEFLESFNRFMQKATPKPHFWTWENVRQTVESIMDDMKQKS